MFEEQLHIALVRPVAAAVDTEFQFNESVLGIDDGGLDADGLQGQEGAVVPGALRQKNL